MNSKLRHLCTSSLLCLALFSGSAAGAGLIYADAELVEFDSASFTYTPSPFKLRQAKKLGIEVEVQTEPVVGLSGYLARPPGNEPAPAIVLVHTCAGLSEHEESWSQRLVAWGYVVLSVDSFKPRGYKYTCDSRGGQYVGAWNRALDAYGAKKYLASLPYVDAERIAVLGMSHGGMTVMESVKPSITQGLEVQPFRAAIAFYPLCDDTQVIEIPVLILTGSEDLWTPAELCQEYIDLLPDGHEVRLHVFEGAHHAFDHPHLDTIDAGYVVRSDPEATAAAVDMVREFLQERL